jgi:6-phosphogluconolactonase
MESTKDTKLGGLQSTFSRRNLLKGAAALAAAATLPEAYGQPPTGAPSGTVWLYIGTYTGAVGSGGNGEGIYLCELNLFTGKLTVLRLVAPALPATGMNASTASPSTLAIDPGGHYLYAGNEIFSPDNSRVSECH